MAGLLLTACTGTTPVPETSLTEDAKETEATTGGETVKGQLLAGHGRVNITPQDPIPLAGYGNGDRRLSTGFLDYTYVTCVAVTDEIGETLLMFASDIINIYEEVNKPMVEMVSAATGVPTDHIFSNATHTHSNIDQALTSIQSVPKWITTYKNACVEAARLAMADREPAKMLWANADVSGYNFVRHYFTDLDESVNNGNHGTRAIGKINRHTSQADPIMSILMFERENAKDILLSTWRAHSTLTADGSSRFETMRTNISADWPGQLRANAEKNMDVYLVYFQGDSGNIDATTSLPNSVEKHPPYDYKEYGKDAYEIMAKAIEDGMEEVQPGPIRVYWEEFSAKTNKSELDHIDAARNVYNVWEETRDRDKALAADVTNYIESVYHAGAILARPRYAETESFLIAAASIGDFAFVQAPFESFDTNGRYVRENSPTKYTFFMGYSNQRNSYLPSAEAFDFGCYEADICRFARGTAEDLSARFVEILNDFYK